MRPKASSLCPNEKERERAGLSACAVRKTEGSNTPHLTNFLGLLFVPMYVYHSVNGPGGIN